MREYLFRGKRKDNGEWVYGYYFLTPLSDEATGSKPEDGWYFLTGKTRHCISKNHCVYEVIPETIGQYTGLKDRNGKEIYEGDVFKDFRGWVAVVEWEKEGRFLGFTKDRKLSYINREPVAVKVIGNAYDNPELIGGEQ